MIDKELVTDLAIAYIGRHTEFNIDYTPEYIANLALETYKLISHDFKVDKPLTTVQLATASDRINMEFEALDVENYFQAVDDHFANTVIVKTERGVYILRDTDKIIEELHETNGGNSDNATLEIIYNILESDQGRDPVDRTFGTSGMKKTIVVDEAAALPPGFFDEYQNVVKPDGTKFRVPLGIQNFDLAPPNSPMFTGVPTYPKVAKPLVKGEYCSMIENELNRLDVYDIFSVYETFDNVIHISWNFGAFSSSDVIIKGTTDIVARLREVTPSIYVIRDILHIIKNNEA